MKAARILALTLGAAALLSLSTGRAGAHDGRYGGSTYEGEPALAVTASLVHAGGGAADFSIAKALVSMAGEETIKAEVEKLTKQYGKEKVASWIQVFDFAVKDALRIATAAGLKLPPPTMQGKELASTLVMAGLEKDNTFNIELLLDKAVSNKIHEQVMDNIDAKFGEPADESYHRISNQAMFDLAHALGAKQVKLSKFH